MNIDNGGNPATEPDDNGADIGIAAAAAQISALMARDSDNQKPARRDAGKPSKTIAVADETEAEQQETDEGVETPSEDEPEIEPEGDDVEGEAEDDDADAAGDELELDDDTLNAQVTVKIDGQTERMRLKDVIAQAQKNVVITRKAEKLAAERREFEGEREQTTRLRERYVELLPVIEQQIAALQPQQPDFDRMYAEDPIEAVRQERAWRQRQEQLALVRAEQRYHAEQKAAEDQRKTEARILEEKQKLLKAKPEWRDPARWQRDSARMAEYARELGIESRLESEVDHALLIALDHASRFRAIERQQKAKPQSAAPATPQAKSPPVLKAGSATSIPRKPSAQEQAQKRFQKSRSLRDAASVLEQMLK
jgi:hypothetical protein